MLALFNTFEAIAKSAAFQVEVHGNRQEQLTQNLNRALVKNTLIVFIDPINGKPCQILLIAFSLFWYLPPGLRRRPER